MKKTLLSILCMCAVFSLAACNDTKNKNLENPENEVKEENTINIEDSENMEDTNNNDSEWFSTETDEWETTTAEKKMLKTSLTEEDLQDIDLNNFPMWYTYNMFRYGGETVEEADYGTVAYTEDDNLLLPIYKDMVSREITSSNIEDDMIYTVANITLADGSTQSLLYINDPETLKYVAVNLIVNNDSFLYKFIY